MNRLKRYHFEQYNLLLVLVILAIAGFGCLMINSAGDTSMFFRQIIGIIIGTTIMIVVSLIDYNFILKFFWLIYVGIIGILIFVRTFGTDLETGAYRWIKITDTFSIQPSEFVKILMILFMAKFLTVYREKINSFRFLGITAIVMGFPLLLLYKQPDLSTTILIFAVLIMMIYCNGLSYRNIFIILLCVIPVVVTLFIYIQTPNQTLLKPYQRNRILAFRYPDNEEYNNLKYQQDQALKAIGSGQLYGKGYNSDDPNTQKNSGAIPVQESDFIFAVIGEELGFVGCCFLILLLAFLVFECIIVSVYAKDYQGRLICCGYAALIAFSTFINIGVVTELLPNTGLPLPFVSQGLSSLMSLFGGAGIVLNVSLQRRRRLN
ncbi:MAG: FtsW/RodA/SpoVE family cell cycle protein [Lachnospiraceae bacterium]|nr:FtsW/RodA/SpoVE family cell cycle protein [Lachnospiraceae bacterium]